MKVLILLQIRYFLSPLVWLLPTADVCYVWWMHRHHECRNRWECARRECQQRFYTALQSNRLHTVRCRTSLLDVSKNGYIFFENHLLVAYFFNKYFTFRDRKRSGSRNLASSILTDETGNDFPHVCECPTRPLKLLSRSAKEPPWLLTCGQCWWILPF